MNIFDRNYKKLLDRREKILSGKINCIPLPFTRFRQWFPGIERGRYYMVTANQKVF